MTEKMTVAQFRASQQRTPASGTTPPDAGRSASRSKKKPSPTNSLTKSIITLLKLEGCTCWRQNNGAVYDANIGGYRAGSVTPGISDILGYHRATGRFLAVEVKTGRDKLSPEQEQFLQEVRRAGGFACEGRSLEQVRQEFTQWQKSLTAGLSSG
ncbi:VRR-NUC domain-containing protein [Hymenobacter glacieicola]|uniref:VRR-NUC domain-containing protein n=1 Tax=Hymenobacter glacieicola TaxID=1562124 RepID=A0ABQ1WM45_9BACT|nr:VRR-NUC domain-containing protein [Hymenobacter glacieicola]GGG34028.1 hypothetical protein GCM10011378_08070 [Hymenobacter glacieicola]